MNLGISDISTFVGMSIEHLVLVLAIICNMVFFAKDFKLGCLMLTITSGCLFMMYYALGWYWMYALIVFFMSIVVLSLNLYFSSKSVQGGYLT